MSLRLRLAGLAIGLGLSAAACTSSRIPAMHVLDVSADAKAKAQGKREYVKYLGIPLHDGQLVLTESPDTTSFVFLLGPDRFYPFTHMGVISIEDGSPWVYDLTGDIKTLPVKRRVLDNVKGQMYRRSLFEFAGPNLYAEIYEPPEGTDGAVLAKWMRDNYAKDIPFDAFFRWDDDHRAYYCSELVEVGIRKSGGVAHEPVKTSDNPSLQMGLDWLGVQRDRALPPGVYIDRDRYVGSLGQFRTRLQAYSYFEAKREIWRRFRPTSQRLGFMLKLRSSGVVEVRPEISDFVVAAVHLFDADKAPPGPFDPKVRAAVQKLAADRFGALPEGSAP